MSRQIDMDGQWERVASELRACREAQQRAWGNLDSVVLGRYLAGEVDTDELRQVEAALEELPELRRLTDLVRDVLTEFEPEAVPLSAPSTSAPMILPFPVQRPSRRQRWRSRGALAASACLLLSLGLALPAGLRLASPGEEPLPAIGPALADARFRLVGNLEDLPFGENGIQAMLPREEPALLLGHTAPTTLPAPLAMTESARLKDSAPLERLDRQVQALEREERSRETLPVLAQSYPLVARRAGLEHSPRYAESLNHLGVVCQKKGDLALAAPALSRAHAICRSAYGPEHPRTVETLHNLATVYQVALNTTVQADKSVASRSTVPDAYFFQSVSTLRDRLTSLSPAEVRSAVLPVLLRALDQAASTSDRQNLVQAIGQLGPAARCAVPVLTERYARTQEPQEQQAILSALMAIGPSARTTVARLAQQHQSCSQMRDLLQQLPERVGRVGIIDAGECFSVRALHSSGAALLRLAHSHEVEVLVETVQVVDTATLRRAQQRLHEMSPRGLYILADRHGRAVRVLARDELRQEGFPVNSLRDRLTEHFRQQHYDEALEESVKVVSRFQTVHSQP